MLRQKTYLEEKLYFKTNMQREKQAWKISGEKLLNPYIHIFQNVKDALNL